jgi:hypothetical protein
VLTSIDCEQVTLDVEPKGKVRERDRKTNRKPREKLGKEGFNLCAEIETEE